MQKKEIVAVVVNYDCHSTAPVSKELPLHVLSTAARTVVAYRVHPLICAPLQLPQHLKPAFFIYSSLFVVVTAAIELVHLMLQDGLLIDSQLLLCYGHRHAVSVHTHFRRCGKYEPFRTQWLSWGDGHLHHLFSGKAVFSYCFLMVSTFQQDWAQASVSSRLLFYVQLQNYSIDQSVSTQV